jgi:hypothetical protein
MKCENEEASIYQDRLQTGIGKTPQKCRFLARCYKEDRHRKKFVLLEKKCVFCRWHTRGCPPMTRSCCADATRTTPGCGKRLLRCHFSRTIEYLPRQPRDTHRENLKTKTFLQALSVAKDRYVRKKGRRKRRAFCDPTPFSCAWETTIFCQDRLGTNNKEIRKIKGHMFVCVAAGCRATLQWLEFSNGWTRPYRS